MPTVKVLSFDIKTRFFGETQKNDHDDHGSPPIRVVLFFKRKKKKMMFSFYRFRDGSFFRVPLFIRKKFKLGNPCLVAYDLKILQPLGSKMFDQVERWFDDNDVYLKTYADGSCCYFAVVTVFEDRFEMDRIDFPMERKNRRWLNRGHWNFRKNNS